MENDLKILKSKTLADGSKYFSLFEKHIPRLNDGSTVYLYMLGNLHCICEIIKKNPTSKYFICDADEVFNAVQIVLDGYDISKTVDVYDIDMTFDCVIMNPPYQRNLHLKILAEAIKHLKDDDSMCVNLSPSNWLGKHSYFNSNFLDFRKKLNTKIDSIEIIDHRTSNDLFNLGNQIEELGIIECKNNSSLDLIKYGFKNEFEFNLYMKILSPREHKLVWRNGIIAKFNTDESEFDVCLNQWSGGKTFFEAAIQKKQKRILVAQFSTSTEKCNFINSLKTRFMEWYFQTIIKAGDYKIHIYGFMMDDYSQPWTDERFKEFFGITDEEWKYIEDTMAKYV